MHALSLSRLPSPTVVVAVVGLGAALGLAVWVLVSDRRRIRLPGPSGKPFVGSLFDISPGIMHRVFAGYAAQYGPAFVVHMGVRACVVVTDAALVRQLFHEKGQATGGRVRTKIRQYHQGLIPHLDAPDAPLELSNGVIMAWGDTWKRNRKTVFSAMLTKSRVAHLFEATVAETAKAAVFIGDRIDASPGDNVFNVLSILKQVSFNNLARHLLSLHNGVLTSDADLESPEAALQPENAHLDLLFGIRHMLDSFTSGLVFEAMLPLPAVLLNQTSFRQKALTYTKLEDKMKAFLGKALDERIDAALDGSESSSDLLTALLEAELQLVDGDASRLGPEHTRNIITSASEILMAGSDTSAVAIAWALLLLAAHPDVQARVHAELDRALPPHPAAHTSSTLALSDFDDKTKLPYTRAVLNEALRVHAVAPLAVPHTALEDFSLDLPTGESVAIPKGTWLMYNIWAIHRDKAVFGPDADEFRPERFLDNPGLLEHPSYMPFGVGSHVCVGRNLAAQSTIVVLALLLREFAVHPVEPGKPTITGDHISTSLNPKAPYLRITRR